MKVKARKHRKHVISLWDSLRVRELDGFKRDQVGHVDNNSNRLITSKTLESSHLKSDVNL